MSAPRGCWTGQISVRSPKQKWVRQMETAVTEIDREPPVTVLAICGEVDAGAEGLERLSRLLDSLVDEDVRYLVVDLSGAEFLISRALGQLLTTAVRLRNRGGDMAIAGATGSVAASTLTTGVAAMVPLWETVETAVEAVVQKR